MAVIKVDKTYENAMAKLSDREKHSLLKVMAQTSEASYRRGVQQGIAIFQDSAEQAIKMKAAKFPSKVIRRIQGDHAEIANWRNSHSNPLTRGFGFDNAGGGITSLDRFTSEYGDVTQRVRPVW